METKPMSLDAMMTSIKSLTDIMISENAALRQRDWQAVGSLAAAKRGAVQAYETALQAFADASALPESDREHLRVTSERLAAVAEENERRLTLVIFAQRRVMAAISEAVISAGSGAATYGRTGGMNRGRSGAAPMAVSLNGAF